MGNLLNNIKSPCDVKQMSAAELPRLADELRQRIIEVVSKNGGHLASNLGSVELTIALMRIFNPPQDKIIWDVGHQAYAWKLLTGRAEQFDTLRKYQGISGFTKPSESEYDAFIAGHAGTSLSAALGFAVGRDLHGSREAVVAVIGDASMSNGIALEALNNIAETGSKLIVILNDNEMSISESVGALSRSLGSLLSDVRYNRIKAAAEQAGHRLRMTFLRTLYHRVEQAIKSIWLKNAFFEEFGLRYIGPIDGHDFKALESAMLSANEYKGAVVVHVATQKGRGFSPAEDEPAGWHGVGPFNPAEIISCGGGSNESKLTFSSAFGELLAEFAQEDERIVAITAAMCDGTGLHRFCKQFPRRFHDVGICEEHAVVFAAGLAARGFRPVFAVYSTFLQRAIDCVMHDVALQKLPVLFCIDRAGIVGNDGPTHHGVFDIAMLRCIPNLVIMQPSNYLELKAMLQCALRHNGAVAIRYPRGSAEEIDLAQPAPVLEIGQAEVVVEPEQQAGANVVWLWSFGDMLPVAVEVARRLNHVGRAAGAVNARFIKPLDVELLRRQTQNSAVRFVTIENSALAGGFGSAVREQLAQLSIDLPVTSFGWQDTFVEQGNISELLNAAGLTADAIYDKLMELTANS